MEVINIITEELIFDKTISLDSALTKLESDISNIQFGGKILQFAKLKNKCFNECIFIKINFVACYNCSFNNCILLNCNISNLNDTNFKYCTFTNSSIGENLENKISFNNCKGKLELNWVRPQLNLSLIIEKCPQLKQLKETTEKQLEVLVNKEKFKKEFFNNLQYGYKLVWQPYLIKLSFLNESKFKFEGPNVIATNVAKVESVTPIKPNNFDGVINFNFDKITEYKINNLVKADNFINYGIYFCKNINDLLKHIPDGNYYLFDQLTKLYKL